MREYSIAAIPADGIGPEVINAGITVLQVLADRRGDLKLEFSHFDWGSDYYKRNGVMMPEDGLERLEKFDAILFWRGRRRRHGKTNTLAHSTPRVCAGAGKLVRTLG